MLKILVYNVDDPYNLLLLQEVRHVTFSEQHQENELVTKKITLN